MLGCIPQDNEGVPAENEKDKEALYGEALLDLHNNNATNLSEQKDLEKRFRFLERQIGKFLDGKKEMNIAQFTRIKIELDYLQVKNYDPQNVSRLSRKFQDAYRQAEQSVEKVTGSLGDRYSILNRTVSRISQGEEELTVAQYLHVEKGLDNLEKEGYMIPARIQSLRQQLLKAVIHELEHAIIDVPDIDLEEEIEEEIEEEPEEIALPSGSAEEAQEGEEAEEKEAEEKEAEESEETLPIGPHTYQVRLIDGGFDTSRISIKVGDTIEWINARYGRYKIGFVIGNGKCRALNSGIFKEGLSYSWNFTEPGICLVSDGIYTTQVMKVVVN